MTNYEEHYREMSDGELDLIARDMEDLTDAAREAMRSELTRRGKEVPQTMHGEWEAEEPVVVAQFLNLHEALLAKGQLNSAGIACSLRDDNMVRIDWFISNLLGGVKLTVPPAEADEARELLASPIPEDFDVDGVGKYEQPRCPRCNSLDTRYGALGATLVSESPEPNAPIPSGTDWWGCAACKYAWVADEEQKNS